ncbi:MAG: polysaccharide biosynthesis tyrosine autokinase [Chloroflexi bacterium]|nr:polysaccharide biosynthesis tyrosine autokinase [Chloroflexota bacterium]
MAIADLSSYAQIILKHYKIILMGVVVCLIAAVAVTAKSPRVYEASATLLISDRRADTRNAVDSYNGVLVSERLAKVYSEVIAGKTITTQVSRRLNLPFAKVSGQVTAATVQDTNLIKISATDNQPAQAYRIVKETVDVFANELSKTGKPSQGKGVSFGPLASADVVDPASIPVDPIKPNLYQNMALALLLGCSGSVGSVMVLELFDRSIKDSDDLARAMSIPMVGMIPKSDRPGLEMVARPASAASEAYRSLRTSIQTINGTRPLRTVGVTSAGLGDGKTTVSANLAVALAQAGHQVILVSCDFRRPSLHKLFHLPNENGLSEVLTRKMTLEKSISHIDDRIGVIVSGTIPPNPAELLGSQRMKAVVDDLKTIAEYVILDCPPVVPVTDAALVGSIVDGTLLIVRAGKTNRKAALRAKELLDGVGTWIPGVILNGAAVSSEYGYSYRYQY